MPFVFVIDDDEDILDLLKQWFTGREYEVETFRDGKNLLKDVQEKKPDLLMLDVKLEGQDGRELCRMIKEQVKYPVKILLASANPADLLMYEYAYADGIVHKPFRLSELDGKIRKLLNPGKW